MSEFHGSLTPPPVEEPIRMWDLLRQLDDMVRQLQGEKLRGALEVLSLLTSYLDRIYFQEKQEFNRKSLVKTIEEAYYIAFESYIHENNSDGEDSE
jgi:hypothetical protein